MSAWRRNGPKKFADDLHHKTGLVWNADKHINASVVLEKYEYTNLYFTASFEMLYGHIRYHSSVGNFIFGCNHDYGLPPPINPVVDSPNYPISINQHGIISRCCLARSDTFVSHKTWYEEITTIVAPCIINDYNSYARTIADCYENLSASSLHILFGKNALPRRKENEQEYQYFAPGYEIKINGEQLSYKWGSSKRLKEDWSILDKFGNSKKMSWEDFYCRLPGFTSGV